MSEPTFDAILRVDRNLEEIVFHAPNHQVYSVRFDAFKISDDFVRPSFMDAELIDEGRTVRLGLYEASVADILRNSSHIVHKPRMDPKAAGEALTQRQAMCWASLMRAYEDQSKTILTLVEDMMGPSEPKEQIPHLAKIIAARPPDEQFREFYRLVVILLDEAKARAKPGDDTTLAVIYNHVHEVLKVSGPILFNSKMEERG